MLNSQNKWQIPNTYVLLKSKQLSVLQIPQSLNSLLCEMGRYDWLKLIHKCSIGFKLRLLIASPVFIPWHSAAFSFGVFSPLSLLQASCPEVYSLPGPLLPCSRMGGTEELLN